VSLFHLVIALVIAARLVELALARRNARRLLMQGAVEAGRSHYPLIVGLHAAWFAAMLAAIPVNTPANWFWLGVFLLLQLARFWVLATLGRFWTTRIITLPGAPLVRRGPYRFIRHPNYLVVELEIVTLPLAFSSTWIAVIFGLANAAMLAWRIRIEDAALSSRRMSGGPQKAT
jgi:methyltransferase